MRKEANINNQPKKRCSRPWVIRGKQIKTIRAGAQYLLSKWRA
jgi:hypothetical protein